MLKTSAPLFLSLLLCMNSMAAPLEIQLVSSVKTIAPGTPFYVALSLKHASGYHTYWKHPGIVGVPTGIKWTSLPRGFKAGAIQWPEPERTHMFSIKAQGYERDVCLPIPIYPPKDLKPGSTFTLKGQAVWMCCADECNPGFKDLNISLSVGDGSPEPAWYGKIDNELRNGVSEMTGWTSTARITGASVALVMTPGLNARPLKLPEVRKMIYFTEDGVTDSDKPQRFNLQPNGALEVTTTIADTIPGGIKSTISGVIIRPGGWLADGSSRAMRFNSKVE